MIAVKRSEVKPGQTFYFNENRVPCIAMADETRDRIKKVNYGGDPSIYWHLYVPTGQLSWNRGETTVYVDA